MKRFVILAIAVLAVFGAAQSTKCEKSEVVKVGRCDSHGSCEVTLKDGSVSYSYRPVVGELACKSL